MRTRWMAAAGSTVVVLCVSLGVALAAGQGEATQGPPDQQFLKEAAQGGMKEVALGKLAVQKASSEEVKQFGQRMVDDHGGANERLQKLATSKGVTLPEEMGEEGKALRDRLEKLSGAEFDRAYMEEMVKDHKKDVEEFTKAAEHGEDPEVKKWAEDTLPTLKEHLQQAQNVADQVGAQAGTEGREKSAQRE